MPEIKSKGGAPKAPEGYEKLKTNVPIYCKASERKTWSEAFGYREVSKTGRALLNQAAQRKLGRAMFKSGTQ